MLPRTPLFQAAKTFTSKPRGARKPAIPLIAPLPLYRQLLRAHRKHLDPDRRSLGDMYIKSEFRLHKDIQDPLQIVGFLSQWQKYLEMIKGDTWRQEKLDLSVLQKMSDEQIVQLYELMQAAQDEKSEYGVFDDLTDKR
ncbi:hypothetical protein B0I72DRAFT_139805 [Yarrowia lipolytica]|jgi:hypothetical protein|uniref:Succinate dehydrogenase assembly factor 3 n=2 Tax=Yarrowia lipolytica TaxID=4952 RepID=Q6CCG6_YARLI|nr:YALI0C09548p [Yarrowia lipolytica CLIB122]AOW02585.1 hypothetical protein YALI1_C13241g [Yarrowia lipolytica]KAB8280759.1 hypothetical protein BKA91DRAFT_141358 [Yarrowia lipolytica]KAE8169864.1 hypothetical protein BKA90DRAFT_141857 [Yarrowia lipolytica]KAJ8053263.1 hypothetical protein LXG23DRAFT_23819 [Yarrowia lipolytica]QNP96527.1 Succinate dehydrogenase assembly factor 3 [Yarrowia lipolytica]|eukprot:XP_501646.1 YALI0C09548p [Yarrowia lipolytica CLIB122]